MKINYLYLTIILNSERNVNLENDILNIGIIIIKGRIVSILINYIHVCVYIYNINILYIFH